MSKVKPYEGNEPYIFISYAHKNSQEVMPIIERMAADGYRVWYDKGIKLGINYNNYIANKIKNCSCFIPIITDDYAVSKFCIREFEYADEVASKYILPIYLHEAPKLTDGLVMALNSVQSVLKYEYEEKEFYEKLYGEEKLNACKNTQRIFNPKLYIGNNPYIFVSFARKNTEIVEPIIDKMIADGYRVWYDADRASGNVVTERFENAAVVIHMASNEYLESYNCRTELNYAHDLGKRRLVIYVSDPKLNEAEQKYFSKLASIFKYRQKDADFYKELYNVEFLESCKLVVRKVAVKDNPIKPYEGQEPYIYINYSHRDTAEVMPIIKQLILDGYRVWYDAGIDPGTDWSGFIADKISCCECMVTIISDNYMKSTYAKDEWNYARNFDKPRCIIYLNFCGFSAGIRMRLNMTQAIYKYCYPNESDFYSKLYDTGMLDKCKA